VDRPRSGLRRWARTGFGALGVGFLLVALVSQWETVRTGLELSIWRLAGAGGLVAVSIVALANGWATLLPGTEDRPRLRRVFYLSQPAKYIPGGIAQPVGQVALTTDHGITAGHSITAFLVHAITSATAGAWLGSGVAFIPEAPTWLRLIASFGFVAPLILWHPVLVKAARLIARLIRRPFNQDLLPTQRNTLLALGWALIGILSAAVAFAVVGGPVVQAEGWEVVAAFSFAFTVGYVAVPFPSGIGIREGTLALVLPATGLATLVAVSAIHRLVSMVAELLVLGASQGGRLRRRRADRP
jgi:hypothetical protein